MDLLRYTYFTVGSDGDDVCRYQREPEDQAQSPTRKIGIPVAEYQLQSSQIRRHGHGIVKPVIPCQCEAERVVDESPCKSTEGLP